MPQTDGLPFKMIQKTWHERVLRAQWFWNKEPETIKWIESFNDSKGSVFLDVGANVGMYSLYAAHLHPDMLIISFEPHRANFRSLRMNMELNSFGNMGLVKACIGNHCGECRFDYKESSAGSSGGQMDMPSRERWTEVMSVYTLDAWMKVNLIHKPTAAWVKIDIDGQESAVLEGMEWLRRQDFLKGLLVEFNDDKERKSWTERLINHGFSDHNQFMRLENHSNRRREGNPGDKSRNVIFVRV